MDEELRDEVRAAIREAIRNDSLEMRHRAERLEVFAQEAMRMLRLVGMDTIDKLPESKQFFRALGTCLNHGDIDWHCL